MTQGAWVLTTALVLATAFGGYRALTDGHFRGTRRVRGSGAAVPSEADAGLDLPGVELGERATLLQFSSAFCAPCRATRRVLGEVAGLVPGVAHVELDAEHHLDLVRRLDVTRTPTTLILDDAGREISRASGAPRRDEVMATLEQALSP